MYLEPVRVLADWLAGALTDYQGANQGVNATLAHATKIPRDAGDPVPDTVAVIDETRDTAAALGRVPEGVGNILAVRLDEGELRPESAPGNTVTRDFSVPILIVIGGESKYAWEVARNASYVARATVRSIQELLRNENANAGKLRRNAITIRSLSGLAILPAEGKIGDLQAVAAVRLTAQCRDEQPL